MSDGDSAWHKRHKEGQFKGLIIPFGALVDFRPPKPILNKFLKFAKRSLHGIFLGYYLMCGERWYGDYLVAPLIDFKKPPAGGVRICRISELIDPKRDSFTFPLRDAKEQQERTITDTELDHTHVYQLEEVLLADLNSVVIQDPTLDELNEETTETLTTTDTKAVETEEVTGGSSSSARSDTAVPPQSD